MIKKNLKREIGLWGLSLNLMNLMVGAGIFILPAIVVAGLGPASFMAYLFCGILIILILLCFAEVGSTIDVDGGVYGYIKQTLGNYFGFIAAVLLLAGSVSADAAIANAIVDIVDSLLHYEFGRLARVFCFFIIFGGFALINILGAKRGLMVVKFITFVKLASLVFFVIMASGKIQMENLQIESLPSLDEIGQISLILFFAFIGSEAGLSVSGEVRNPQKTIPMGIIIAVACVLILYILIQTAAIGVLGTSLAEHRQNPLGEVAKFVLGPVGLTLMIIGAGISMLGNLSSIILSMPRVLYGTAKDRVIPIGILSAVHPKFATPFVSILVYAGLDFILASAGGFEQLVKLSTSLTLLLYFGMVMTAIVMRIRKWPRPEGTFMIPGGYLVPVAAALIIIWLLAHVPIKGVITTGIIIAFLTILYFTVIQKFRKKTE